MSRWMFFSLLLSIGQIGTAHAQGRRAVSALPSRYACLQLNFAPGFLYEHPEVHIPAFAAPSSSAPVVGQAIEVMVARWPQEPRNGFVEIQRTQTSTVWVEARFLKPWASSYGPPAHCQPSIMSDGSIGTRIR